MYNNKSILITGGTGSFGNAFVRMLTKNYKPKRLVIYSRDELKQFKMATIYNNKYMRYFIGDVRDLSRLNMAMESIDICIHAAAMKQVVVSEYNPMEAIKTNVLGAENVITASINNKVKKILALSTDKAAGPINLYGATKLVSDKLFISANNIVGKSKTKFSVVRYGNVAGSRGSVIPFYLDLIKNKNSVMPLTHKDMTRFVITLNQGVNFVAQSINYMKGGEVFIPKIKSLRLMDLISSLPNKVSTKLIGIRPGEKIHEILFSKDESQNVLSFKDFYVIKPVINFTKKIDFTKYGLQKGKKISKNFEYSSNDNNNFMKVSEIRKLIKTMKFS